MVTDININGKDMTVIVLGEKDFVNVNEYRETILDMFKMATLWSDFHLGIKRYEMLTVLKFLQALGFPEEEEGGTE